MGRDLILSSAQTALKSAKISVPIGVVGIIYEARPNVTADAAAICLKAGNNCCAQRRKGSDKFQYRYRKLHE